MKPTLYSKLLKQIHRHQIQTLTIDVFDTILLNEYWPADLRDHDLTRKWLPILQTKISSKITSYEIYSWRKFAKQELLQAKRPLRIDLWVDALVELLCIKYHITLDHDQHLELLAALISAELEFVVNNTKPNLPLLAQLSSLKKLHPELKFYFLADSHLTAEQIKTIFDIFDIKLFDGGICSSDLGQTKKSGELYELLESQLAPKFDLTHNLHLGDELIADYQMPLQHDSQAIHYRPLRMRGLRTLVGKTAIIIMEKLAKANAKLDYEALCEASSIHNSIWQQYGALSAQAQTLSAWQLHLAIELEPETNFLLADVSATQLINRAPQILDHNNVRLAASLNQTTLLQAYVWLLATYHTPRWNAVNLLKLVFQSAGITQRQDIYNLCFTKDYIVSDLALQSFEEAEFWQNLLSEIENNDSHYTDQLRSAYEIVAQTLISDGQPLYLIDFDQSIIDLYRNFAQLHGITSKITERQFSCGTIKTSLEASLNSRRQNKSERGGARFITIIQNIPLSPIEYFNTILRPSFKRLTRKISKN